jgi:type IV pilus secretin PilQ/predicted competence protein
MSARLSSLLVVGGVTLVGGPGACLAAAAPAQETTLPAASLGGATFQADAGQGANLDLAIPAYVGTPRLQVLDNPRRVVVDLPGVNRGLGLTRKDLATWNGALIQKSRIAQFAMSPEPVTRLVLEVAPGTQVTVTPHTDGVKISLLAGTGSVQAKLAPFATDGLAMPSSPRMETEVVAVRQEVVAPAGSQTPAAVAPVQAAAKAPLASLPELGTSYQPLPAVAMATLLPAQPGTQDKIPVIAMAQTSRRDDGRGRTLGDGEVRYTGSKMSIDVSGVEITTFLKSIADTARLNLIVDSDIQGLYSFKFTDCPWDLILDVILKHAGLGKEINNGVLRVAKVEKLQKEEEDRKKLDEAKALAGDLVTITKPLSFAKAADAKGVIEKLLTKRGSLIVDERTNTLIITDLPKSMQILDELIQQMDVQIQQVQIEARVVEATGSYEKAFGVKWPTSNSGDAKLSINGEDATWGFGPSWNSAATTSGNKAIGTAWTGGRDGVTSLTSPAGEFWVSFLSNKMSVNVILQALEKDGKIKIVSSPKVVTQNNKKAKILAGEKIPYPTIQSGNSGGAITVAFIDANLQLDVTPQITNDGTILMDLKVTKAEGDFSQTVNGTPRILHKEIETQVLVKDGGTAVLGGVYTNTTSKQTAGVPFLSKIPILGWLFRMKDDQEKNSELLVFITPRILKN